MSANSKVLQTSKAMLIEYISALFQEITFDDINVPGIDWRVYNLRFHTVHTNPDELDIWIEGDVVKVRMRNAGGSFTGNTESKKIWPMQGYDHMSFDYHADKGGFDKIEFDFGLTKQFVDGRTLPSVDVRWANFEFNHDKMRLDVDSDNWLLKTGGALVNTFKDAFLWAWKPILNAGFPSFANIAINIIQINSRGNVNAGIIQSLVDILPFNDIRIPEGVYINYEMPDDNRAKIEGSRMIGFFKGDIMGVPEEDRIHNETYLKLGDLVLTSPEPFEYEISNQVINNMFQVILGHNHIENGLPHHYLKKIQFPIRWDSTTLEQFIPDLTDYIGYDVPLSAHMRNIGAPRFIYNKENIIIQFSCEVEVWYEDYSEKIMTFRYHDIEINFDMWLEGMNINTEWYTIKMDHAEVTSDIVDNLEKIHANRRITHFFNMAFDMIIPWVNEFRPEGVAVIPVPDTLADLVKIRDLKMAVRENYFAFTCDPEFIIQTPEQRRRHLRVLSDHISKHLSVMSSETSMWTGLKAVINVVFGGSSESQEE